MLRTDTKYVDAMGQFTQAGVRAVQTDIEASTVSVAARVTAVEAELAGSLIGLQPAVSASGQTAIDFTGIPAWVNRVAVIFSGLSTSGTSDVLVQLGDSGGIETTGYTATQGAIEGGAVGVATSTAGFPLTLAASSNTLSGIVTVARQAGDAWVAAGTVKRSGTGLLLPAGDKTLSGALTQLRITAANGTDTFDAGSVAISWE